MNARKLLTLVVAATVLVGGLATAGAAMPADAQANDKTPDDPDENTADDADGDADENASESDASDAADDAEDADGDDADSGEAHQNRNANANNQGPPSELPEQVPDHVSSIHETINAYLDGDVDNLGNALNDLLGADGDSDEAADETSEDVESEDADSEDSEDADSEDVESEDADSEDADSDDANGSENASDVAPVA